MDKTFIYYNHQDKGKAFYETLKKAGWRHVREGEEASIVLADSDVTPIRKENLQKACDRGAVLFLYPHAARPPVYYDFKGYPQSGLAACQFVVSPKHAQILRVIGYEGDIQAVGWSYCQLKQFVPVDNPRHILFAPVHANGTGWLHEKDIEINRNAFEKARRLARGRNAKLTVRFIGNLKQCGLDVVDNINYVQGRPDQSIKEIDNTDLVITTQTFQYLAVARGKPVIGMGESVSPKIGSSYENFEWALSWDKYRDMMRFPLDILDSTPMNDLVDAAIQENEIVQQWRKDMIWRPYDSHTFLHHIEKRLAPVGV